MQQHIKTIQNIGLNKNQANVYLACLELGPSTVIKLSKHTGIIRTTIYDNLRVLKEHGLIAETIDDAGKILFTAENPQKLLKVLENKKQQITESLPSLIELFNTTKTNPKIQFFSGKQGITKVTEISRQENPEKEILILGDLKALFSYLTPEEKAARSKSRVKKAIRSFIISTNTPQEMKSFSIPDPQNHKKKMREVRMAHENLKIPFLFYIFHNKVALLSSAQEGYTIIFESPELSTGLKSLFTFLWEISKEFEMK